MSTSSLVIHFYFKKYPEKYTLKSKRTGDLSVIPFIVAVHNFWSCFKHQLAWSEIPMIRSSMTQQCISKVSFQVLQVEHGAFSRGQACASPLLELEKLLCCTCEGAERYNPDSHHGLTGCCHQAQSEDALSVSSSHYWNRHILF